MASRAAVGLRAHSGWAALVVVAGAVKSPAIIDRRRIELAAPEISGSIQPYHAAQKLPFDQAQDFVRRCEERTMELARQGLLSIIDDLTEKQYAVTGCGLLLSSARPATTFETTLASHALVHAAEGELFRHALMRAAEACNLPVRGIRERDLLAAGAQELGMSAIDLRRRLAELGRQIGPPWQVDQKYAALAGWLALIAARATFGRPAT